MRQARIASRSSTKVEAGDDVLEGGGVSPALPGEAWHGALPYLGTRYQVRWDEAAAAGMYRAAVVAFERQAASARVTAKRLCASVKVRVGVKRAVASRARDGVRRKFVTVFGVYCFALGEVEAEPPAGGVGRDGDALGEKRFEVHLDARAGVVPERAVGELVGLEVGAELAVESGEHVAVEGCGDAFLVVVGGEQGGGGLGRDSGVGRARGEVGAEQQASPG